MTLTIELPEPLGEALKARAVAQGLSASDLARDVLEQALDEKPLSARIRDIWRNIPPDVQEKLPLDGASQIDHYVYGLPKRGE